MFKRAMNAVVLATLIAGGGAALGAQAGKTEKAVTSSRIFVTPEAAGEALADAVRAEDVAELLRVVGPSSRTWLMSGDRVADREEWKRFLAAYDVRHAISESGDGRVFLLVGEDGWAFPAPLVRKGKGWGFDLAAGREEVLNRRIGRNELATMKTMLEIVDAQREYAAADPDGDGYHDYARKIRSSDGKRDGLYWPTAAGEVPSPLGELIAHAANEGYGKSSAGKAGSAKSSPGAYHGYRYRLLTSQGKDAHGGAYSYLVNDRLIGGFAVVAYPAKYGVSGIMTFITSHEGVVYEKNLGPETEKTVAAMRSFNPGAGWKRD